MLNYGATKTNKLIKTFFDIKKTIEDEFFKGSDNAKENVLKLVFGNKEIFKKIKLSEFSFMLDKDRTIHGYDHSPIFINVANIIKYDYLTELCLEKSIQRKYFKKSILTNYTSPLCLLMNFSSILNLIPVFTESWIRIISSQKLQMR
ncbi:MAG: hypothetical protein MHPSP_000117, partial [Paramarteilia canceri]